MKKIHETVYVHPLSSQMGDVEVGEYSSLWPGSSIRGDFKPIKVGRFSSIQDNCTLHATPYLTVEVGDFVTVGHGAVLHACKVEDDCLIGMNSTILDGAVIGKGTIVAAGSVIREKTIVPPNSFVAGVPAEIKPGKENQSERIRLGAISYSVLAQNYRQGSESISADELLKRMGEMGKIADEVAGKK